MTHSTSFHSYLTQQYQKVNKLTLSSTFWLTPILLGFRSWNMANRISVSTKKLHFVSDMIRCTPFSWSVLCSPFVSICLTLWSTPLCLPDTMSMTLHFVHLPDTMMYSSVPDTDVLYSILSVCLTPWCTICMSVWHYDVLHSVCLCIDHWIPGMGADFFLLVFKVLLWKKFKIEDPESLCVCLPVGLSVCHSQAILWNLLKSL